MQSIGELATLVSFTPSGVRSNLGLTDRAAPSTDPDSRLFPALGDPLHRPGRWILPRSVSVLSPRSPLANHPDADNSLPAALSYGYCYTIAIASEVSAASVIVSYWTDISPALVISIGLALILFINLMPIRLCVHTHPLHRIRADIASTATEKPRLFRLSSRSLASSG